MHDLIWVGNTLYPRWVVFAAIAALPVTIIVIGIIVDLVQLVRKSRS